MKDQTKLILSMLEEGKSCNEMCEVLGITNRQLYTNLTNNRNKGFLFTRDYTSNGDILYKQTNFIPEEDNQSIIKLDESYIKLLIISDLHFGNEKENLKRVEHIFNYCKKNNIHIIFCCGDFLDGTYSQGIQIIPEFYNQVDYFIRNYPFDKNILTFGVGGDHDLSGITDRGQNFLEAIYNYRHDCIIPSFCNSIVNIKNTNILLHHHNPKAKIPGNVFINFFGHCHKYDIKIEKNGRIVVKVPSISDINVQSYELLPSALETELFYEKDKLVMMKLGQLYYGNKDYLLNQISYEIPLIKKKKFEGVDEEIFDDDVPKKIK